MYVRHILWSCIKLSIVNYLPSKSNLALVTHLRKCMHEFHLSYARPVPTIPDHCEMQVKAQQPIHETRSEGVCLSSAWMGSWQSLPADSDDGKRYLPMTSVHSTGIRAVSIVFRVQTGELDFQFRHGLLAQKKSQVMWMEHMCHHCSLPQALLVSRACLYSVTWVWRNYANVLCMVLPIPVVSLPVGWLILIMVSISISSNLAKTVFVFFLQKSSKECPGAWTKIQITCFQYTGGCTRINCQLLAPRVF